MVAPNEDTVNMTQYSGSKMKPLNISLNTTKYQGYKFLPGYFSPKNSGREYDR